jgi:L-malate glycosyltransferase
VNIERGINSRARICHVISGDLWAGAEVMTYYLLCGLNKKPEIELLVLILNKGKLSDELIKQGIHTCILEERRQTLFNLICKATKILKKWKPDIIHSHRYKENILAYLISISLRRKTALICTQHGMPEHYGIGASKFNRIKSYANFKLLSSKYDLTVAVSSDIKKSLVSRLHFPEDRIEMIHNGIPVTTEYDHEWNKEYIVIGSAGRFVPVKDYSFMVEVAKEVSEKTDKIKFVLAGDGPMLGHIQYLIQKHSLQKSFILSGHVDNIDSFYKKLDVYMNTSLHEGIPMSVLEAMVNGVPTIAPKIGGFEEIITDGVDGYLMNVRNPKLYSEKCLTLLKNRKLLRNMSRAARRKIIENFSSDRMVMGYLSIYMHTLWKFGRIIELQK